MRLFKRRQGQVGTTTWYHSRERGLHDVFTHSRCPFDRTCSEVDLPVDRRGRVIATTLVRDLPPIRLPQGDPDDQ